MGTSTDDTPAHAPDIRGVVVDCSVFVPWYLEDESSAAIERFFGELARLDFWVPWLWQPEFVNALDAARRRGRISEAKYQAAIDNAALLPLHFDENRTSLVHLARLTSRYDLTAYDATYLELAQRRKLPLATLDEALRRAAPPAGVKLYRID